MEPVCDPVRVCSSPAAEAVQPTSAPSDIATIAARADRLAAEAAREMYKAILMRFP